MNIANVFDGVIHAGVRQFLGRTFMALKDDYPRLYNPCCGTFGIAQVAVAAGYAPENIQTSDIGVYSSVLGYTITGRSLRGLGLRGTHFAGELLAEMTGDAGSAEDAALALLALWWQRRTGQNPYVDSYVHEVEQAPEVYVERMAQRVECMAAPLRGMSYEIADIRQAIPTMAADGDAVIAFTPPWFAKGYEQMFDGTFVQWDGPPLHELHPGEIENLEVLLDAGDALSLIGRTLPVSDLAPDVVHATEKTKADWCEVVTANRPEEVRDRTTKRRRALPDMRIGLKLHDGSLPPPTATVGFGHLTKEQTRYLRSLWSHLALDSDATGSGLGLFIDGAVAGVSCYAHTTTQRQIMHKQDGEEKWAVEWASIICPNSVRLLSLQRRCLLSTDTRTMMQRAGLFGVENVVGLQSSFFSRHPAITRLRGLMKIHEREEHTPGILRLVYRGRWRKATWEESLREWLTKEHPDTLSQS